VLTVLMPTHNGAATLPVVLEAYARLARPPGGWKLTVVDNASTDETAEIVRSFETRLPLSSLHVAEQGQNVARNRGLGEAEGDLVVFTDDDVVPDPDWLVEMRAAADAHPEYAIFSGVIRPRWMAAPEPWHSDPAFRGRCYTLTDPAWEEGPCDPVFAWSPNMAIRMDVFRTGYRFDEAIGPRRGSFTMGSETSMTIRLRADGYRAWHVRGARVEHMIRPFQMTKEWAIGRSVRYGRGEYRWSSFDSGRLPGVVPTALRNVRGLLSTTARLAAARLKRDGTGAFRWRWERNRIVGRILESVRVGRQGRREFAESRRAPAPGKPRAAQAQ
jgi:glycosyltransferase involved in cell wall biosynthesis